MSFMFNYCHFKLYYVILYHNKSSSNYHDINNIYCYMSNADVYLIVFCSFHSGILKATDAVPLVSLPLLWVLTMTEPHVSIRQTPLEHTMHGR